MYVYIRQYHTYFFYESYDNIAIVIMESQMKAIWLDVVLNEVVPQVSEKKKIFFVKVQLFWEGHKNLKKSPTCFDTTD